MKTWSEFRDNPMEWDKKLASFSFSSLYQSYKWGEIKSRDGWTVHRLMDSEHIDSAASLAQLLLKRLPLNIGFFWCPGGVMGSDINIDISALARKLGFKRYYLRSSFHNQSLRPEHLKSNGWSKSSFWLNSNKSMILTLSDPDHMKSALSSNWRHNLRRFEKKNIRVERWKNPDPIKIYEYYQKFEALKGLSRQHSFNSIEGVVKVFKDHLIVYKAFNDADELLALRGYIYYGSRALDWYAISTDKGRSCYASYGVLWKVFEDAQTLGINVYDLSGVDPANNKGVYNFKKGTGAELVLSPGEYEKASSSALAYCVNKLMRHKMKSGI